MRIGNKVIKGRQGVWLVDVLWDDGRKATLPTAHHRFFDSATKRYAHNNTGMLKYPGKLKAWKEAIVKHGAVVMTDDDWIGRYSETNRIFRRVRHHRPATGRPRIQPQLHGYPVAVKVSDDLTPGSASSPGLRFQYL